MKYCPQCGTKLEENMKFCPECGRRLAANREVNGRTIADYDKAIRLNPNCADAYCERGDFYYEMAEYSKAVADYDRAIELVPNDADAYYSRGCTYGEMCEYEKAIDDFSKAIELDPVTAVVYYNRGLAYREKGRVSEAVSDLKKCVELATDPELTEDAGQLLCEMEQRLDRELRPTNAQLGGQAGVADVIKAEGITGQLEVVNGVLNITRKGLKATLSQGKKGELSIPLGRVTRVDYRKPGLLGNGHIHFLLKGEDEGSHSILNCPRTVIFGRRQEKEFESVATLINEFKDRVLAELRNELKDIVSEIVKNKDIAEQQIELLKKQDKESLITFYSKVYEAFETDKELDESEINTLKKIQDTFSLSNDDVNFDERVRPYIYVYSVKKEGMLPTVNLRIEGGSPVILRKDEIVHFADSAVLKEVKSVSLGYSGGSHGVSFPIGGGIRYRVGGYRGHVVKEDRLLETSRGVLIISNQRLFLHPSAGHKPLSIPLNKILSYQCFENGIEVYKEGKEKGHFFSIGKGGSVELFGLCLGHLLKQ
jgi:tetratricopeptide (TPR) repeat protein